MSLGHYRQPFFQYADTYVRLPVSILDYVDIDIAPKCERCKNV